VSIVIFDSRAPAGEAQAVWVSAAAYEGLADPDLARGVAVFSRASLAGGAPEWRAGEVLTPALHRLYRATASEHWVLDPAGHLVHGRALDHRTPVTV
jgi:hypothetical protein